MCLINRSNNYSKNYFKFNKRIAFTLAEVLIAVGIIGIVAEMTIPVLMKNFQQQVLLSQFKRTSSILGQAYSMARVDNDEPNTWSVTSVDDVANILAPYLQVAKKVIPGNAVTMGYKSGLYDLRNNLTGTWMNAHIQLKSGEIIGIYTPTTLASGVQCTNSVGSGWSSVCFFIFADVNGLDKPNRFGFDIFVFQASPSSISPFGGKNSITGGWKFCDTLTDQTNWGNVLNGAACGSWIQSNGNMDYLKCFDGDSSYCHSYQIN